MICNYSYKRQTRAPYCALYSSPRQQTVGTPPALPARKPGLKSASPAGDLLSLVWACPRPERFPILYLHVTNNNTQGKILYCSQSLIFFAPPPLPLPLIHGHFVVSSVFARIMKPGGWRPLELNVLSLQPHGKKGQ